MIEMTVWILVSFSTASPLSLERFATKQKCEALRIQMADRGSSTDKQLSCLKAEILVPERR